jgi:hypothetical protein
MVDDVAGGNVTGSAELINDMLEKSYPETWLEVA